MGICLKLNVIVQLESELAYSNTAVRCFNHYTTMTPLFFIREIRFMYNILLLTQPARTYIYQLCVDTGCSLKDLPRAIDVRGGWRKRKRIREHGVISTTWWFWWWWYIQYKYMAFWPWYFAWSRCHQGCSRGVMVKALDCGIVVSEFKLQSCYYVQFRTNTHGKGMNTPYPPSYGLNSIIAVLLEGWLWY